MGEISGSGRALPAIIQNVGGPLVEVLLYPQHRDLPGGTMFLLATIVGVYKEQFGDEYAIDLIAEIAGRHGIELDAWFEEQLENFGIERLHLAIEAMRELGIRPRPDGIDFSVSDTGTLTDMLELLEKFDQSGGYPEDVEGLAERIAGLGGWRVVTKMSIEEIINKEVGAESGDYQ